MVECEISNLAMRVRFPLPAPRIYGAVSKINMQKYQNKKFLIHEYIEKKKSMQEIADGLGVSLHDVAYWGETKADHPLKVNAVLGKYQLSVSEEVNQIIKAHGPDITGVKPKTKAEWSIFCADSLTGLITAVALILPSKKLADVKLSSVMKRLLKQPKFAAGTRREEIKQCVDPNGLNLPVEKFVEICLNSMKSISSEIGL